MLIMSDDLNLSNITVDALQKATPTAVRFFLDWHLACTGCGFARFCTLGSVVRIYQLNENDFLKAAQHFVAENKITWSAK